MSGIALELSDEVLERIALRAAELVAERNGSDPEGYLDVQAAAAYLSCPVSRIYSLVSANRIPHHRDGSRLLFDRSELRQYVNDGGAKRP